MAGEIIDQGSSEGMSWRSRIYAGVEGLHSPGLVTRSVAFFIDMIILGTVPCVLRRTGHLPYWLSDDSNAPLVLFLAYFVLFEMSPMRATPGKWCCGFFVAGNDGEPLPWWRVLIRNLLRPLSLALLMSGLIICLFDRRHRMLHDMMTGSRHFNIPLEEAPARRPVRPVWH